MGQRHISSASFIKLFNLIQIFANGIGVFNPDHSYFFSFGMNAYCIFCGKSKFNLFRSINLNKTMNGVKFFNSIFICLLITLFIEFALPSIDNQPGNIKSTFDHFREIYLGIQIAGIISISGKITHIDVIMRIYSDDRFMNFFSSVSHADFTFWGTCLSDQN